MYSGGFTVSLQKKSDDLRIVFAGSVNSSRRVLQALLRHGLQVVGVLGASTDLASGICGYSRMDDLALGAGVPYLDFHRLNDPSIVETVRTWKPDLLFVIGLSQLVKSELMAIPRLGCVGFHPTWLPEGRGRAPVAWLVLEGRPGAANFFLMDEGADSGPILVQEPFYVGEQDYAADVWASMEAAIDRALDRWLPRLLAGEWLPQPQNHNRATYYARRAPSDGNISWFHPVHEIHALIRASSHPHPGAYTYLGNHQVIIWRAQIEHSLPMHGVVGRVLSVEDDRGALVQASDGLIWLNEFEIVAQADIPSPKLRVGVRLGYAPEDEIYRLHKQIYTIEERLNRIEEELQMVHANVLHRNKDNQ
jgi:methionyl-tRNA formyltransferase